MYNKSCPRFLQTASMLLLLCLCGALYADADLSFKSDPPGAGVFCNGEKLGETPLLLSREDSSLPYFHNPGKKYDFIIYKEFFEGEIVSLSYQRGEKRTIDLKLHYLQRLPRYNGTFQVGYRLDFYQLLVQSNSRNLRLMRNEIYAKHGRAPEQEFAEYFAATEWFKPNPYYTDDFLTETDRANLELIASFQVPRAEDRAETERILQTGQYTNADATIHIVFHQNNEASLYTIQPGTGENESQEEVADLFWKVFNENVYLWDAEAQRLYEVLLDQEQGSLLDFQEICVNLSTF